MVPRPKTGFRRHVKGQADHVDAWLMSYADMVTLLLMLFIVFVSVTVSRQGQMSLQRGEPEHPYYTSNHSGLLKLGTSYDELYRTLDGIVTTNVADQHIAVEKNDLGIWIDMSAIRFFDPGAADIPEEERPLLNSIAHALKEKAPGDYTIEVEGYADDQPLRNSRFADNWELTAMRAAHIVSFLIGQGIDPARLHAASYANNHPLVPNNDAAGNPISQNRARNQRIVIKVERAEPAAPEPGAP